MMSISNKNFYILNAVITTFAISFLAWLLYLRPGSSATNLAVTKLPAVNATLNGTSAVILIAGLWAIKNRREVLHRNLMITALCVTAVFLVSYIYYHSLQGDTKFLGEGWIRPVYFFTLISHIILSIVGFPMILSTVFFGLSDKRKTHRKLAKFTFPIWLYVSVTGVIIFFLLRSYS